MEKATGKIEDCTDGSCNEKDAASDSRESSQSNLCKIGVLNVHGGMTSFECEYCHKCFKTKSAVVNHRYIHMGEKSYKCGTCQESFRLKRSLIFHNRTHTGKKQLKCLLCGKLFRSKSMFLVHKNTHTSKKPFRCKTCVKSFPQKGHLGRNMRVHTDEKPFKCDICVKSFRLKERLRDHIHIHTGEKPFKCDFNIENIEEKVEMNAEITTKITTGEVPTPQKEDVGELSGLDLLSMCTDYSPKMAAAVPSSRRQCLDFDKQVDGLCSKKPKLDLPEPVNYSALNIPQEPQESMNNPASQVSTNNTTRRSTASHKSMHTGEIREICEICEKSNLNLNDHSYAHSGQNSSNCEIDNADDKVANQKGKVKIGELLRKEESLGLLCKNFMSIHPEFSPLGTTVTLDKVVISIGRMKLYDIVDVLQSMGMMVQKGKNKYIWFGKSRLPETLAKLKTLSLKVYGADFILPEDFSIHPGLQRLPTDDQNKHDYSALQPGLQPPAADSADLDSDTNSDTKAETIILDQCHFNIFRRRGHNQSLKILCHKFIMLFMVAQDNTVSLDRAAKLFIAEHEEGSEKHKNIFRKLHLVASILTNMNFLKKCVTFRGLITKASYKWIGLDLKSIRCVGGGSKSKTFSSYKSSVMKHSLLTEVKSESYKVINDTKNQPPLLKVIATAGDIQDITTLVVKILPGGLFRAEKTNVPILPRPILPRPILPCPSVDVGTAPSISSPIPSSSKATTVSTINKTNVLTLLPPMTSSLKTTTNSPIHKKNVPILPHPSVDVVTAPSISSSLKTTMKSPINKTNVLILPRPSVAVVTAPSMSSPMPSLKITTMDSRINKMVSRINKMDSCIKRSNVTILPCPSVVVTAPSISSLMSSSLKTTTKSPINKTNVLILPHPSVAVVTAPSISSPIPSSSKITTTDSCIDEIDFCINKTNVPILPRPSVDGVTAPSISSPMPSSLKTTTKSINNQKMIARCQEVTHHTSPPKPPVNTIIFPKITESKCILTPHKTKLARYGQTLKKKNLIKDVSTLNGTVKFLMPSDKVDQDNQMIYRWHKIGDKTDIIRLLPDFGQNLDA